jgi:thiamine-monophosphate kinase
MACSTAWAGGFARPNGRPATAERAGSGEFGRIARYFAPLAATPGALGLTDDAALLSPAMGEELVVTADALVEGVHFLPGDPPDLIARKLLRCNLSDLAAMAARPFAYVLTMALPGRCDDLWVERFAHGLGEDQAAFGITLLGGDSVSTPGPISLSLTAFGLVRSGTAVRRNGARAGDLVYVSGTIGDGALGLLAATGQLDGIDLDHRHWLADRYRLPQPRVTLGPALAGLASAMMDISDGLVGDLDHIAETSYVAAVIEAPRVPISAAAASVLALDPGLLETILTGGDDYELLFTIRPDAVAELQRCAAEAGVPVTAIGRIDAGEGVRVLDRAGCDLALSRRGFRHG